MAFSLHLLGTWHYAKTTLGLQKWTAHGPCPKGMKWSPQTNVILYYINRSIVQKEMVINTLCTEIGPLPEEGLCPVVVQPGGEHQEDEALEKQRHGVPVDRSANRKLCEYSITAFKLKQLLCRRIPFLFSYIVAKCRTKPIRWKPQESKVRKDFLFRTKTL